MKHYENLYLFIMVHMTKFGIHLMFLLQRPSQTPLERNAPSARRSNVNWSVSLWKDSKLSFLNYGNDSPRKKTHAENTKRLSSPSSPPQTKHIPVMFKLIHEPQKYLFLCFFQGFRFQTLQGNFSFFFSSINNFVNVKHHITLNAYCYLFIILFK